MLRTRSTAVLYNQLQRELAQVMTAASTINAGPRTAGTGVQTHGRSSGLDMGRVPSANLAIVTPADNTAVRVCTGDDNKCLQSVLGSPEQQPHRGVLGRPIFLSEDHLPFVALM